MSRLQELIAEGEELLNEPYDSPDIDMWQNDVKSEVAKYGQETMKVLDRALWFGSVITSDQQAQSMHREMIAKVQKLLANLDKRNVNDTRIQSQLISQKSDEAKASVGAKFGNMTINGPVTFGDNSPANNLQVGEIMMAIIAQAEEQLPEGEEKNSIIQALKLATTNPTFAAIAGSSLPEIIKRLIG